MVWDCSFWVRLRFLVLGVVWFKFVFFFRVTSIFLLLMGIF